MQRVPSSALVPYSIFLWQVQARGPPQQPVKSPVACAVCQGDPDHKIGMQMKEELLEPDVVLQLVCDRFAWAHETPEEARYWQAVSPLCLP